MAHDIKVKICGLGMQVNIDAAVEGGADFLGFVFHRPSPRNVAPRMIAERVGNLPPHVKTVGVIVDKTDREITDLLQDFMPHYLQLHGMETIQRTAEIHDRFGIPIIKACPITTAQDIVRAKEYEAVADMLLLDARAPLGHPVPGGHGVAFDWGLLRHTEFNLPWFLSGGINIHNVRDALALTGATMIDVSSGVEKSRGVKDPERIRAFLDKVKHLDKAA